MLQVRGGMARGSSGGAVALHLDRRLRRRESRDRHPERRARDVVQTRLVEESDRLGIAAVLFAGLGAGPVAALTSAGLLCSLFVIIHLFQSANRKFFAEKIEDCWPDAPGESVTAIHSP